jgi:RNA polymerase sigma-70 factor (ECF subfamily)
MGPGDADLVKAVREGRRDAYAELVRRHAPAVSAVCASRVGPRGPVEDMVQEAFLRGFRMIATLEDPARFPAWVCGIALRACLDWLKAKERGQVSLDGLPDPSASAEEEVDDRGAALRQAVDGLPEIYREVLYLFYYRKMSYQDMGRILGVTSAAVNARLTKARAMLRDKMARAVNS